MPKEIMTKSERLTALETLDQFFNQSREDDQTFYDALSNTLEEERGGEHELDVMRKVISGKPDKLSLPKKFEEHLSGYVRIHCGRHRDDYVWHIEPASIRRTWRVTNERVIFVIAKIMNDLLPSVEAKIWPPASDWEIRTITFKALGLAAMWNFDRTDVEKINNTLFDALNPLV